MAYQPRGIFVGNSLDWLQARLQAQYARLDGQVVSFSEAGQSTSQSVGMSPDEQIIELNFAIGRLTGTSAPTRTRADYGGSTSGGYGYACDPARSDSY